MFTDLIETIAKRAAVIRNEGDYTDDETGLLRCGKCGEEKQRVVDVHFAHRKIVAFRACRCERENDKKEKSALEAYDRQQRQKELNAGIKNEIYRALTFEHDDGRHREVSKVCCDFVRHFEEMEKLPAGLLFYGGCGLGKTFHAASIGNALLKRGVPTLFSTLRYLIDDRLSGKFKGTETINFKKYRCFFVDDVGSEKYTKQDLDVAFQIVDELYNTKKPVIVTTNLNLQMLEHPESLELDRIYSRLLERAPKRILVSGDTSRLTEAKNKRAIMDKILQGS